MCNGQSVVLPLLHNYLYLYCSQAYGEQWAQQSQKGELDHVGRSISQCFKRKKNLWHKSQKTFIFYRNLILSQSRYCISFELVIQCVTMTQWAIKWKNSAINNVLLWGRSVWKNSKKNLISAFEASDATSLNYTIFSNFISPQYMIWF